MNVPDELATRLSAIAVTHAPALLEEPLKTSHQECFELALRETQQDGDPTGILQDIYTAALVTEMERILSELAKKEVAEADARLKALVPWGEE